MRERNEQARQLLGCGYAPPPDEKLRPHVERSVWDHEGRRIREDERDERGRLHLPVCPGYVCTLPEVVEATWAHSYWEKGELTQYCEGQSTPALRDAIAVYAIEVAAMNRWAQDNPPPKAGG